MKRRTDIPGAMPTGMKILLGLIAWAVVGGAAAWLFGWLA